VEDLRKTPLNPVPNPKQLEPEYVERIRRIQLNDLENIPFFLVAAFLYVLTEPSLLFARLLLYGYVASSLLHFTAYFTAQTHETRATFLDDRLCNYHLHGRPELSCGNGILT
jgi:glutathione S-transferase